MSELLERFMARATDDAVAVIDQTGSHSYATVARGALGIASALRGGAGGAPLGGRRVALFVHPSAEFVAAFFGVLLAGGCVVVLSPLHPLPERRYFCADAGIQTVLVSAPLREQMLPVLADATANANQPSLELRDVAPLMATPPATDLARAVREAADASEAAPALLLYTSGTTGKPKGAILTHGNIGTQQRLLGEAWGFGPDDVLLHALPLHHMHGIAMALLTAIGAGATVRMRSFDASAIWDDLANVTVFMAVPAMYHRLFGAFDAADATRTARWAAHARALRLATSGSAALPVTLAERWRQITGAIPLERFGMTEVGVGLTNSLTGARFPGSVGLPLPTVEARIVASDEGHDAHDAHDAEVGELWIRGPSVFAGYHERPDETAKAFAPCPRGGSPWFRTGDTVTRDVTLPGHPFRILGRTSVDILKSGGYKLSALEIEEVLRDHPSVAEAAVIGVADEAWGDRVVACIVTRPALQSDEATLRAFVRERLAPYKVPKDIVFLEALPKNAIGKVLKPTLVKQIEATRRSPTQP